MSPGDQDDILHPVNPQSKLSGPCEPAADMLDYLLSEIFAHYRVPPPQRVLEGIILRLLSSGTQK